ncbi:MAG: hypothetical protein GY859_37505, partial [Desulfobacterales bacterium]|nr:hypothetical protein [Desulfobacterales bacterium]
WSGGANPGGWAPGFGDSNYFHEFAASVTADGENGAADQFYGLYACGGENADGQTDIVLFRINKDGFYRVIEMIDGDRGVSTGAVESAAITGENDRLTILKQGDLFRFFINSTEVEFLKLEGHFGGSAGLTSDHGARPSFDDFEIVDLAEIQPDYNAENQRLNIPLLDVLNAGAAGGAYEAALNLNSVNPVAFDLTEIGARQADDALFSRYDIFNSISSSSSITLSPHRPAFDFNDNTLRIPSVRLDDGAG